MSSLLQCTDDLLQQKVVQSSHYERLERQLLDRERRRRTAVLTLKQHCADLERRSNDVVDLRNENAQLADQLAQHALQLAALQCRTNAAQKAQKDAVARLQDSVRSWSGHPAQIVLIVQALQMQKKLSTCAKQLLRVLRCIGRTLRLRRQVSVFARRCVAVMQWHTTHVTKLTCCLQEKMHATTQSREAAVQEAEEAEKERAGPLMRERCTAQQTHLLLEAQLGFCEVYTESMQSRCALANEEVPMLSNRVDAEAVVLSTWEVKVEEATTSVTELTKALFDQREVHAAARAAHAHQQQQMTAELAEEEDRSLKTMECVRQLTEVRDNAQRRSRIIFSQMLVVGLITNLCGRLHERRVAQQAVQQCEQNTTQQALAKLRAQHADKLRERQMIRAEAAQRQACETVLRQEGQQRNALVGLEGDEWRLLHAQLVRDACRARAAAAEAAETAAAEAKKSKSFASVAASVDVVAGRRRAPLGKRPRGGERPVRPSAASRRQRAALGAVDELVLAASHGSCVGNHSNTGDCAHCQSVSYPSSPTASITAPSHTSRTAYRLVSLKPPLAKTVGITDKTKSLDSVTQQQQQMPGSKFTKHTLLASAMSPFMAATSESDSSFSLMNDSSMTQAVAAGGVPSIAIAARTKLRDTAKAAAAAVFREEEGEEVSGVCVFSSSPSPVPRRPAAHTKSYAPARNTNIENVKNPMRPTAVLPLRHTFLSAGGESTGVDALRNEAPRSALATALAATCTPHSAAMQHALPVMRKASATSGNASALPVFNSESGGGGTKDGAQRPRSGRLLGTRPAAPVGAGRRQRVPPLMPTAAGEADDLFADLFS